MRCPQCISDIDDVIFSVALIIQHRPLGELRTACVVWWRSKMVVAVREKAEAGVGSEEMREQKMSL